MLASASNAAASAGWKASERALDSKMAEEARKQLRIKTGSVSRLRKEINLYTEEVSKQQAVVERLKQQGADSHDIKHAARG